MSSPSPVYRLLTTNLPPDLGGNGGKQLLEDLAQWDFDPNEPQEGAFNRGNAYQSMKQPVPLLMAFVASLPARANDDALAAASRIIDLLVDRGADPAFVDQNGNTIDMLAPRALAPKLVKLRGGDVERSQAYYELDGILRDRMLRENPFEKIAGDRINESPMSWMGVGEPVWMLAMHQEWSNASMVNGSNTISGETVVARKRASHTRRLMAWANASLPQDQSDLANFLGWCVSSCRARDLDNPARNYWEPLLEKLEPDDIGIRLEQARRYLDHPGPLAGDLGLSIARAVAHLPEAGDVWARAIALAYGGPGAAQGMQVGPHKIRLAGWDRMRPFCPAFDEGEAKNWHTHLPPHVGADLVALAIRNTCQLKDAQIREEREQLWEDWACHWLDTYPQAAFTFLDHMEAERHRSNKPAPLVDRMVAYAQGAMIGGSTKQSKSSPRPSRRL